MTTLEQDFAKAKAEMSQNIRFEAERWAAWLCVCREELAPFPDALYAKEDEDTGWNPLQRNLFLVLYNLPDVTFLEIKNLLIKIGNVDDIWNACLHICYMYSFGFFQDKEVFEKVLEDVERCDKCFDWLAVYVYQYVALGTPLTMSQVFHMAHSEDESLIWGFVRVVENEVLCGLGYDYRKEQEPDRVGIGA